LREKKNPRKKSKKKIQEKKSDGENWPGQGPKSSHGEPMGLVCGSFPNPWVSYVVRKKTGKLECTDPGNAKINLV